MCLITFLITFCLPTCHKANKHKAFGMEHTGFEPVTSTLPVWRAPNCANTPWHDYNTDGSRKEEKNQQITIIFLGVVCAGILLVVTV